MNLYPIYILLYKNSLVYPFKTYNMLALWTTVRAKNYVTLLLHSNIYIIKYCIAILTLLS